MSQQSNNLSAEDHEILNKLNASLFEKEFTAIRSIYIDLALLKDIKVGCVLTKHPEMAPVTIANLDEYNLRLERGFETLSKITNTDDDYYAYLSDKENTELIFRRSPDTVFSNKFTEILSQIQLSNSRCDYDGVINITINTYPFDTNSQIIELYKQAINLYIGDSLFKVDTISVDPINIQGVIWKRYDMLFIDDIAKLSAEGIPFSKELYELRTMYNVRIYTPYVADKTCLAKIEDAGLSLEDKDNLDTLFAHMELVNNIFCQFKFAKYDIPKPKTK